MITAVPPLSCPYDTSPEAAIEAIRMHDGPLFIDLDETLYLRNSTEDFIDLARPGLLAVVILRVLSVIRPWRWTGGDATRDTWRMLAIVMLLPWTRLRWRRNVGRLAQEFGNTDLVQVLRAKRERLVIATLGFHPVVKPLVAALGFPEARIIASRASSFEDRRRGKLLSAVQTVGQKSVDSSLVLTDSLDDLPLLANCARPLRTIWPRARFRHALANVYFPGEYVARVKHPGQRYLWRVIVQEDLAAWVLSSIVLAPYRTLHVLGVTALLASFWVVYERGYVDNDWAAEHLEEDGKLSGSYWHSPVATPWLQPWLWAAGCAALAIWLLEWPGIRPWDLAKWLGVLLTTYATFKLYNRINKSSRMWLYAGLQFARVAAFLILVRVTAAGVAALAALILARWVAYYVYRLNGGGWPELQINLIRLLFFLVLTSLLVVVDGPRAVLDWSALALLAWNVFRARFELMAMLSTSARVDRSNADRSNVGAAP